MAEATAATATRAAVPAQRGSRRLPNGRRGGAGEGRGGRRGRCCAGACAATGSGSAGGGAAGTGPEAAGLGGRPSGVAATSGLRRRRGRLLVERLSRACTEVVRRCRTAAWAASTSSDAAVEALVGRLRERLAITRSSSFGRSGRDLAQLRRRIVRCACMTATSASRSNGGLPDKALEEHAAEGVDVRSRPSVSPSICSGAA